MKTSLIKFAKLFKPSLVDIVISFAAYALSKVLLGETIIGPLVNTGAWEHTGYFVLVLFSMQVLRGIITGKLLGFVLGLRKRNFIVVFIAADTSRGEKAPTTLYSYQGKDFHDCPDKKALCLLLNMDTSHLGYRIKVGEIQARPSLDCTNGFLVLP